MPEQMGLPGIEATPALTDRLILVVLPDVGAIDHIQQCRDVVAREQGLHGRGLITERLHVSLQGLGDYPGVPRHVIDVVGGAAARVAMKAFTVVFDRVLSFAGRDRAYPLVLVGDEGVAGLVLLQRYIVHELQRSGVRLCVRAGFNPHMTLLYSSRKIAERFIEPVSWKVRDFALVHSRIGMNLPYRVLGRWSLKD